MTPRRLGFLPRVLLLCGIALLGAAGLLAAPAGQGDQPLFGDRGKVPGGCGGRTGSTRELLLLREGGNYQSDAAVAEGLLWLARHQAAEGYWSLDKFNLDVDLKFPEKGERLADDSSKGQASYHDNVAGTAF